MKKLLVLLVMLLAGAGLGAGGAYGARQVLGPPKAPAKAEPPSEFVPVDKVSAPLVLSGGGLAGYVSFDAKLEVPADQVATVTAKLPLLLDAINMRTYRVPLAAGPDGMLPDLDRLRAVVTSAAPTVFGPGVVRRVAITRAEPI